MENLEIYEGARSVPKEATKAFSNGRFSGTDIAPMWRIKKLTELFGPAGIGWYTEIISERCESHGDMTMAIVDINLYIKYGGEWSKPIFGTGGNVLLRKNSASDEGYKMAYTDALSVACKALGIGADVYWAGDATKYTQEPVQTPQEPPQTQGGTDTPLILCERCGRPIVPYIGASGKTVSVERHLKKCREVFGAALCIDCVNMATGNAQSA